MYLSTFVLAALATLTAAQNPFNMDPMPSSIKVGTPFNITWMPSTGTVDTVTLLLRQGDPNALKTVETIAENIQNTGSYLWTPSAQLVNGPQYAFEIIDNGNKYIDNYSGQFSIDSPNTSSAPAAASSTSSSASSAASSSSASASTTDSSSTSASSSTTASSSESSSSSASGSSSVKSTQTKVNSSASQTSSATSTSSKETSSSSSSATPSATGHSAATKIKVSGGLLAVVGAGMALL